MKLKLFFSILLFSSINFHAQSVISGNVYNENKTPLLGVLVININTDQQSVTDKSGHFLINAKAGNYLRFVSQNYERISINVHAWDFYSSLNVEMSFLPTEIKEVKISFQPTGNLAQDLKRLPKDDKTPKLNREIVTYLKYKQTEVIPENKIPTEFAPRDFSKGQLNLFDSNGGGILGAFVKLIKKKRDITEPNYNETEEFLKKLKQEINPAYYYNLGMSEEQLIQFLADANSQLKLAKMYRNNFNIQTLERLLHDYMKTYRFKTSK